MTRFRNPRARLALIATLTILSPATRATAQPTVAVEHAFGGVSQAIGITSANDGTGRLFVIQQTGEIMIWDGGANVLSTPFLDLSTITTSGGEQGLLGLAFHPDYSTNGLFYVNYSDLSAGDTVIAAYGVSAGNPNVADPNTGDIILTFEQEAGNHNGGDLHFGPDGFLYIASGDGGADWTNAQNPANLLGKLLRIDVDSDDYPGDPSRDYGIPADNPLVGVAGAAEEIWQMGLRNPWRFSFDRATGDLFIGDVGEGAWEEVNFAPQPNAGVNWGWPCFEGADPFQSTNCTATYDFPILVLPHDPAPNNNCSVIGGYRYRGSESPAFGGWYFFSDWCTGTLWAAAPEAGGDWNGSPVGDVGTFSVTGYGESEGGELFAAGGWQIVRIFDPTNTIFTDGFESGDTSRW